jgi:hypothetical protein
MLKAAICSHPGNICTNKLSARVLTSRWGSDVLHAAVVPAGLAGAWIGLTVQHCGEQLQQSQYGF